MREEYKPVLYERCLSMRGVKDRYPNMTSVLLSSTPISPEYKFDQEYFVLLDRASHLILSLDKSIEEVKLLLGFPADYPSNTP